MPATLRIELFPQALTPSILFWTKILNFTLLRHEPSSSTTSTSPSTGTDTGYAHLHRDTIGIGLSTRPPTKYPLAAQDPSARPQFRKWPVGVEIVIEVDDVWAEKERVVREGWKLESDMVRQPWGLRDFRIVDPDGYFVRVSERGGVDGQGEEVRRGQEMRMEVVKEKEGKE